MGGHLRTEDILAKHRAAKGNGVTKSTNSRATAFARAASAMIRPAAPAVQSTKPAPVTITSPSTPARDVVGDMCARLGITSIGNLAQLAAHTGWYQEDLLILLNEVADQWNGDWTDPCTNRRDPDWAEWSTIRDNSWMTGSFDPDDVASYAAGLHPATSGLNGYSSLNVPQRRVITRTIGGQRYEVTHVVHNGRVA